MKTRSMLIGTLILSLIVGCGGKDKGAAPKIDFGRDVCAACGMTVSDPLYAGVIQTSKDGNQAFDAIECLVRQVRKMDQAGANDRVWLADFDAGGALRLQQEMTIVVADFPSPMAGGLAAFADQERARAEAVRRGGTFGSLANIVAGAGQRPTGN